MTGTLASTGDGVPVPGAPPAAVADADLTALAEAADDSVWLRSVANQIERESATPMTTMRASWGGRMRQIAERILALLAARDEARAQVDLLAAERRELAEQVDAMSAALAKAEGERDALELVVIKAVTHLDTVAHDAAHRGDQDDEAIELAGQLTAALPTTRRDGA
jgi:chromosome segregation ATPase